MNLETIQDRLIMKMRQQVQNGALTERVFARTVGISQTHVHNVLKGARALSAERMDHILKVLNVSVLDLFTLMELNQHAAYLEKMQAVTDIPFLAATVGPGLSWNDAVLSQDCNPVPCSLIDPDLKLVLARLTQDISMNYGLEGHNIAALDLAVHGGLYPAGLYAIDRGVDVVLRRVRLSPGKLYLASDVHLDSPENWEPLNTPGGHLAVVRGRVVWFGRERKKWQSDSGKILPQKQVP